MIDPGPRRNLTRRQLGRMAALLAAGSSLPFYNEFALAQGLSAFRALPPDATLLNANENPMGPCPEALEAARAAVEQGGRYLYRKTFEFLDAMAAAVELPKEKVAAFAGSSDPLHRTVLAFTSSSKAFVVADPGYEAGERAARFVGAKVVRVPLLKDGAHDVRGMAAADPDAGLIYVCNPNNPTGSVTPKREIEYLVEHKPKGAVVLVDEAYLHFSESARPCIDLVAEDKDVVVLRTFSKLYGMAGLRAGAALARPDLMERIKGFGFGAMPVAGMAAATASLKADGLVERRRAEVASIRADTLAWLGAKGYHTLPTEANMFMVDVRRPGREVFEAMLQHKVAIGRVWPSLPTHVRITVGTREEMAKFKRAFERVIEA
ncbi:MAG TPA: pyridoxal phosphate-dependent aminotransferase [Isosphaeraceae bacterium]|jgi:histidinol-phosphate aminotransferase|nr:pyridoxal phosphate-dependent aminotransferase [Isosphaeraceae bacterium]